MQERYGEIRTGEAIMIFVTEPFSRVHQTKADEESDENISVLKLNFTKNFLTGIYPYSIMTSVFYPINGNDHALKVASSIQEWCGMTYMELINDGEYVVDYSSYFQGESKSNLSIKESYLEDEIWTMIRVNPDQLPEGEMEMIPAFTYLQMHHKEIKKYDCIASKSIDEEVSEFKMTYPDFERELIISYRSEFPHEIVGWTETYPCNDCNDESMYISTGKQLKSIKIDYWNKNSQAGSLYREKLGLK